MYTGCKQRGLVTVNYYDLRAACLAMHSLAGAALGEATLEVQYPVPSEQSAADREDVRVNWSRHPTHITLDTSSAVSAHQDPTLRLGLSMHATGGRHASSICTL